MIKLTRKVNRDNFYSTRIQILNGILKITTKEIEVLVEILKMRDTEFLINKHKDPKEIETLCLSTNNRQIISEKLKMSIQNFNNYIKSLKDKNILLEIDFNDNKYLIVSPGICSNIGNDNIIFDLIYEE